MRECNCVQELYLYQWVIRINVEVEINHDIEEHHLTKDNQVSADAFNSFYKVDCRK